MDIGDIKVIIYILMSMCSYPQLNDAEMFTVITEMH